MKSISKTCAIIATLLLMIPDPIVAGLFDDLTAFANKNDRVDFEIKKGNLRFLINRDAFDFEHKISVVNSTAIRLTHKIIGEDGKERNVVFLSMDSKGKLKTFQDQLVNLDDLSKILNDNEKLKNATVVLSVSNKTIPDLAVFAIIDEFNHKMAFLGPLDNTE